MEIDLPFLGDDLPEGEAFPTAERQQDPNLSEELQSSTPVAAPMRRKTRAKRIIPADREMELGHRDLVNWNQNYLSNMAEVCMILSQS